VAPPPALCEEAEEETLNTEEPEMPYIPPYEELNSEMLPRPPEVPMVVESEDQIPPGVYGPVIVGGEGVPKYHLCAYQGCQYRAKYASHVKQHRMDKHNLNITWHRCDQPGCIYKAKTQGHIKRHKAYKHDMDVVYHYCDAPDCTYKAKAASEITKHKSYKHDINVTFHSCDMPGCNYKAKTQFEIKRHKTHKHNLDVVWHQCDVLGCDYQAKAVGNIVRHKRLRHDPSRTDRIRGMDGYGAYGSYEDEEDEDVMEAHEMAAATSAMISAMTCGAYAGQQMPSQEAMLAAAAASIRAGNVAGGNPAMMGLNGMHPMMMPPNGMNPMMMGMNGMNGMTGMNGMNPMMMGANAAGQFNPMDSMSVSYHPPSYQGMPVAYHAPLAKPAKASAPPARGTPGYLVENIIVESDDEEE
jgi:hypothetical protein